MFKIKYTKEELKNNFSIEMWSENKIQKFRKTLLNWYDAQNYNFPWRQTKDPYKIWISEIMLQQTRVETVIPYYENFLQKFPTIKILADAEEDEVLKMWEGLGYYSRAKNLKEAAEQIVLNYNGIFPNTPEEMIKLKGIGPYTAGAISSIAYNIPVPAVDGNLMRVLSRLFEINLDISVAKNKKIFETVALYVLDQKRPGDFNQAMMDLGRTICTPKNYDPKLSPVREFNASYLNGTWEKYPIKKQKKRAREKAYIALAIKNNKNEYLLKKQPSSGLLANMWLFPLVNVEKLSENSKWKFFEQPYLDNLSNSQKTFIETYSYEKLNQSIRLKQTNSGFVKHIFTHLVWKISLFENITFEKIDSYALPTDYKWIGEEDFEEYVFPTIQKKLLQKLNEITLL